MPTNSVCELRRSPSDRPLTSTFSCHPKRTLRVLDRLVNSAHHVAMLGKSFRPNQRPGRTPAANPKEASHE